jgi:MFS superfamily sulfate permease-like transporter
VFFTVGVTVGVTVGISIGIACVVTHKIHNQTDLARYQNVPNRQKEQTKRTDKETKNEQRTDKEKERRSELTSGQTQS